MAYTVTAWLAVRLRRYRSQSGAATLPPVTVLKPLCGAERHLYDCLRSFCDQAYPGFQIVFGVRDPEDPALIIVRRLQREFQGLDLHVASNPAQRSEEHTSELQSPCNLVCRLLLEKKKIQLRPCQHS